MARGKKKSWRDKTKGAARMGRKNSLRGGHYPLVYVDKVYGWEDRHNNEAITAEVIILEGRDLAQTEWPEKPNSEKMVKIHAHKARDRADVLFFVDMYDAALSSLKAFLGVLEGIDMFELGDEAENETEEEAEQEGSATQRFEAILDKAFDEQGDNPYHGLILEIDAPVGYTKENKRLIPMLEFIAAPDGAQEMAEDLLAKVREKAA